MAQTAANRLFLGVSVIILSGRVSIVPADGKLYLSTAAGTDHVTEDKKPSTDRMLSLLSRHELEHASFPAHWGQCVLGTHCYF